MKAITIHIRNGEHTYTWCNKDMWDRHCEVFLSSSKPQKWCWIFTSITCPECRASKPFKRLLKNHASCEECSVSETWEFIEAKIEEDNYASG